MGEHLEGLDAVDELFEFDHLLIDEGIQKR